MPTQEKWPGRQLGVSSTIKSVVSTKCYLNIFLKSLPFIFKEDIFNVQFLLYSNYGIRSEGLRNRRFKFFQLSSNTKPDKNGGVRIVSQWSYFNRSTSSKALNAANKITNVFFL